MTDKRYLEIFYVLRDEILRTGSAPSQRRLRELTSFSWGTVNDGLKYLEDQGYIIRKDNLLDWVEIVNDRKVSVEKRIDQRKYTSRETEEKKLEAGRKASALQRTRRKTKEEKLAERIEQIVTAAKEKEEAAKGGANVFMNRLRLMPNGRMKCSKVG